MKSYSLYVNNIYMGLICADKVKVMGTTIWFYLTHKFWFDELICTIKGTMDEKLLRIDVTQC